MSMGLGNSWCFGSKQSLLLPPKHTEKNYKKKNRREACCSLRTDPSSDESNRLASSLTESPPLRNSIFPQTQGFSAA
ncbi:hypothetical protein L6164_021427 [Bauhinia variegata]|nr:hypothetical protein L6164_021427 [Bauhinia variegata]